MGKDKKKDHKEAKPLEGDVAIAVNAVRVLSADMVQNANSGHPGAPIGMAPCAYALFTVKPTCVCSPALVVSHFFCFSSPAPVSLS